MEAARTEFVRIVVSQYSEHCKLKEIKETIEGFTQYLLGRTIIKDVTIKRLVIVTAYPFALDESLNIKRSAIWAMEERFKIPESTIKCILQRHQKDFRLKG